MKNSRLALCTATILVAFSAIAPISVQAKLQKKGGDKKTFDSKVVPYMKNNCVTCHSGETPADGFRIPKLDSKDIVKNGKAWKKMEESISNKSMPPKGSGLTPSASDNKIVVGWIKANLPKK